LNFFDSFISCYLIAEIGVNHNGNVDLAKRMVLEAKKSGANAVKFQTFTADSLVSMNTPKVAYQIDTTSPSQTHFEMIKDLELSKENHFTLFEYCNSLDIEFLSTPYDVESAIFLNDLGVSYFKTASADIIDYPLHEFIASTGKPTLIATGMANLMEIDKVLEIYKSRNNNNVLLLHCVSNYPCSDHSINLRAMKKLKDVFSVPVGYSDHSIGFLAAALSLGYGAKVIEKHFTLDKFLPGPDHKASSTPAEFKELVDHVRRSEMILGSSKKLRQQEEQQMALVSRKSIFIKCELDKDHILRKEDLHLLRPGDGISPIYLSEIIGKKINKKLEINHKLSWGDLG
jgi:N,N'-diacetyllegionaminate synthase